MAVNLRSASVVCFFDPQNSAAPIDSSEGWLNIYVDYAQVGGAFDEAQFTNLASATDHAGRAVDGDLWLSLNLRDFEYYADPAYVNIGEPLVLVPHCSLVK